MMNSLCILSSIRLTQFWPIAPSRHAVQEKLSMYKFNILQVEDVEPHSRLNPHARSGHRMVSDEFGDLYSFGGYNKNVPETDRIYEESAWLKYKPLFQELWKFDWRTKKWRKLRTTGDIPDKLVSHCMVYWNDKIILFGGTGLPYGFNSSNKLTLYHTATNHWETVEPLSEPSRTPPEMYGQACVCDNERGVLYVVGGTNGTYYTLDVHKFELYTRRWSCLYRSAEAADEPGWRYRHEIALNNNKIYVFGGSTNTTYYGFEELPVFDLETNNWTYYKTSPHFKHTGDPGKGLYPRERKCHSLGVIGKDCYLCGGTSGDQICSDVWHINLDELKWTLLISSIPTPVYFHAGAMSADGRLTIFGGVDDLSGDRRNNKITTIWMKVPSLKNMCLTAVDYYVKQKTLGIRRCRTTGLREVFATDDEDGENDGDQRGGPNACGRAPTPWAAARLKAI